MLPVIFKLDKAVTILDNYIPDATVAFEEPLQFPFSGIIRNISDVNSLATGHLEQGSC